VLFDNSIACFQPLLTLRFLSHVPSLTDSVFSSRGLWRLAVSWHLANLLMCNTPRVFIPYRLEAASFYHHETSGSWIHIPIVFAVIFLNTVRVWGTNSTSFYTALQPCITCCQKHLLLLLDSKMLGILKSVIMSVTSTTTEFNADFIDVHRYLTICPRSINQITILANCASFTPVKRLLRRQCSPRCEK